MPLGLLVGAVVMLAEDSSHQSSSEPPPGAIVLFDGKDLSHWVMKKDGGPPKWTLKDGYIEVVPDTGFIMTKEKFGDFQLHVEFWIPLMADKKGEARGNSGVYLQGRHEVQILDSYRNRSKPTGACGALYGTIAPTQNASKPPETWQTYDITYRAPQVDDGGKVTQPGEVTVVFNGVTVIDHGHFEQVTDRGGGAFDEKVGTPGPIMLQDHHAKVRFRNIWVKPLDK
jgi:hypothetical protein